MLMERDGPSTTFRHFNALWVKAGRKQDSDNEKSMNQSINAAEWGTRALHSELGLLVTQRAVVFTLINASVTYNTVLRPYESNYLALLKLSPFSAYQLIRFF